MSAPPPTVITREEIATLRRQLEPLVGLRIDWLSIPATALPGFEPSQVAVIVNTILDGALPQIDLLGTDKENIVRLRAVGLRKAGRTIGEREGYPDYEHQSGYRLELKGLFVDNPLLKLKRPPTKREASARLKENVTVDVVNPAKDVLLIAAAQLQDFGGFCHPVIIGVHIFPMIACIRARDIRLRASGGRWLDGKIPQVVKKKSLAKFRRGETLTNEDFAKDTNFGKLNRIPYKPLQDLLNAHGYKTIKAGELGSDEDEAGEE